MEELFTLERESAISLKVNCALMTYSGKVNMGKKDGNIVEYTVNETSSRSEIQLANNVKVFLNKLEYNRKSREYICNNINNNRGKTTKYHPTRILISKCKSYCRITLNCITFDGQSNVLYEYDS